jgi:hypothetical protein
MILTKPITTAAIAATLKDETETPETMYGMEKTTSETNINFKITFI